METKPQKSTAEAKQTPENFVKDIRRKARRIFSSEQKILIVMEALRGEDSVAAICRRHGIAESLFYKWNKEFLDYLRIKCLPHLESWRAHYYSGTHFNLGR